MANGRIMDLRIVTERANHMKLCQHCSKTVWPFLFAFFIAGVAATLTWLILSYSSFDATTRLLFTAIVFVLAVATLVTYMLACMRRFCRHANRPDSYR